MSLSPPSYVATPHVAYVNFFIGGTNITKFPDGRPRSLQSFRFENQTNDTGTFTLQVIDPTWEFIDRQIVEAFDGTSIPVTFNWGYEGGGIRSRTWQGFLTKATPTFVIDGIMLTLEGCSTLGRMSLIKRNDTYPSQIRDGVDNFLRPDEIVTWMAQRHGFNPIVEKCKEIKVADAFAGTELVPMRFVQQRMTDLQFIKNVLCPVAVSERTGEAGYIVQVDEKKNLYFQPAGKRLPPARTFVYMREKQSEVISFEVDYEGMFLPAIKGFEKVTVPYVDAVTGEMGVIEKHNDNTPEKVRLSGNKVPFPMTTAMRTKNWSGMVSTLPEKNKEAAEARAMARYFDAWNAAGVKASLTIVGDDDDRIQRDKVCTVFVLKPDGTPHPVSGNYHIWGKVDEVSGGRWTTTLQLQREGDRGVGEISKGVDNTGGAR